MPAKVRNAFWYNINCTLSDAALNHLLHFIHCQLPIIAAIVYIFIYGGCNNEKFASHGARSMVFNTDGARPIVGIQMIENVAWINSLGGWRILTPP